MTVQMREGWVLLRNGTVGYARLTRIGDEWPWSFGRWTFRNDGTQSYDIGRESECDVVELLDPWDARVPEEHREKRFVSGQYLRSTGDIRPCVLDRKTNLCAPFMDDYWAVRTAEMLNSGTDHEGYTWRRSEFVSSHDTGSIAEQDEPVIGQPTNDPVNHPPHYTQHPSGVECIQVTQHMNFCLGNAVKYIWRADLKNDAIEDLKKAAWYINREIDRREGCGE